MTPFFLLDDLAKEVNRVLSRALLKNGTAKVYTQNVPPRLSGEDADERFPYCLIVLDQGREDDSGATQDIVLIFAVCDDNEDYQGYRDVLNMIQAVREHFLKYPILAGRYEALRRMEWTPPENERDWPYFFGGLLLTFRLPQIEPVSEYT